jgi:anti-anti-sigma factor
MSVQVGSLEDVVVSWPRPGAAVVECRGEHDLTIGDQLDALLTELVTDNDLVVIDVSEAQFIDSTFLHLLLKSDRLARQRGSTVRLQHSTGPIVAGVLEISGVIDRLDSVTTREEALR